jgi:predicted nucleotidyltransferase
MESDLFWDFSLWKRFAKERQERAETYRQKVLGDISDALASLSKKYSWDEAFIFGSVIHPGRFSERSDADIAIRGLNKFLHYQFVADMSALLERDADIVRLEDCSFAEAITERGIKWIPKNSQSF